MGKGKGKTSEKLKKNFNQIWIFPRVFRYHMQIFIEYKQEVKKGKVWFMNFCEENPNKITTTTNLFDFVLVVVLATAVYKSKIWSSNRESFVISIILQ